MRRSRSKKQKTVTVIEVDVRKLIRLIVLIVMSVLTLITLVRFCLRQISVDSFEIEGDTLYQVGELRQIVGVARGDKLYRMDLDEMEEKILAKCFDIKSINIKRKFPNRLIFEVEERKDMWYLEIANDYYVLDEEMLVIEETGNEEMLIQRGITKLTLPNLSSAICGQFPVFGKLPGRSDRENEQEITKTCELLDQFQKSALKTGLTSLDLESRFGIRAVWQGSYDIYFGDYHQIDTKILSVWDRIVENKDRYAGGSLDASNSAFVSFLPLYTNEEETS